MIRKVIKQGHNTLTITLPSKWAARHNITAKSELELNEKDNGLLLSFDRNGETKKAEFDISNLDLTNIWKYFMAVYREGYSEVKVTFSPDATLENPYKYFAHQTPDSRYKKEKEKRPIAEILQGFVNRFIGFEIVEHGKDYVLIKEMGELTSKEFDNSLRRVFLLIQQMAEESFEAAKTNNTKTLTHMHEVDINVDKFHDYCIRVLNRIGNKDSRKSSLYFSTLYLLELIGDEYKNIACHLINDFPNAKLNKGIETMAGSIKEEIDLFYDLFYKFDKEKVEQIARMDKERVFGINKIYENLPSKEEKEIIHHFRVIGRYINALMELRIEMEF